MDEKVRQQLVDDHFLFVSGDKNLQVLIGFSSQEFMWESQASGMERDWPEGRGIFHNKDKTFLTWVSRRIGFKLDLTFGLLTKLYLTVFIST